MTTQAALFQQLRAHTPVRLSGAPLSLAPWKMPGQTGGYALGATHRADILLFTWIRSRLFTQTVILQGYTLSVVLFGGRVYVSYGPA